MNRAAAQQRLERVLLALPWKRVSTYLKRKKQSRVFMEVVCNTEETRTSHLHPLAVALQVLCGEQNLLGFKLIFQTVGIRETAPLQ